MTRSVRFLPAAADRCRVLAPDVKKSLGAALRELAAFEDGDAGALDVRRLRVGGRPSAVLRLRLRVGEWRVAFTSDAKRIVVLRVFPRSEGYDWFDRVPVD